MILINNKNKKVKNFIVYSLKLKIDKLMIYFISILLFCNNKFFNKVRVDFASSDVKKAFCFFTSFSTKHKVVPPGVTAQNPGTVFQQISNEQNSMFLGSGWTPLIVYKNNTNLNVLEAT